MAAQKAQLLLKFAQVAAKEAARHNGLPQVAVGAWEGLHGISAPGGHADASGAHPPSALALAPRLHAGGALGPQLPAAASLLQPHVLGGRDVPAALDQSTAAQHFPAAGLPWQNGAHHADPASPLAAAPGSALMPPRCVPDAASGAARGLLGARAPRQQQGARAGQQNQQQGGRRGGRAHSSSSVGLNKQIMTANTTSDLLAIVRQHGAGFDFFNISTAIARVPKLLGPHACGGQLDPTCKALVDDLSKLMEQHINAFDARGLANSAWALGRLRYAGPSRELPALIAAAAKAKLGEFCAQNIANTLWALVYMHHRSEPLLRAAAAAAASKAADFKPQELANLVWAYASMEYRDDKMLAAVARQAHALAEQFNEQELSNLIWGLGKLRYGDPALFGHLLRCVASKLHAFTPQGIANVAWGIATAGHRDEPLFRRLLSKCVRELPANDVQGLANLMWAAGALGVRDEAFMAAAVGECCRRADDLSPQQLANVLWACATLDWADPRAVARLADAAAARSGGFEPQALSNCAWALARLGAAPGAAPGAARPQAFEALAAAALPKARAFTGQGCANLLWAFATAGHPHPKLFDAIGGQAVQRIDSFSPHNCSVTAWACASARHYSPALCDALLARALGASAAAAAPSAQPPETGVDGDAGERAGAAPLAPQGAANLLWALARLGHPVAGGPHACALRDVAVRLMPSMARQELCNSGWALAALGLMDGRAWGAFCAALGAADGLAAEDLQQAYHAQLLAQAARTTRVIDDLPDSIDDVIASSGSDASRAAAGGGTPGASPGRAASPESAGGAPPLELPEPLRSLAERCWRVGAGAGVGVGAAGGPPRASRMLGEAAAALEAAGAGCALGVRTADGLLCVDLALEVDGQLVAIEAAPAAHYSSNDPRRPLGDAGARRRLLRARGWRVVQLAPHEWDALPAEPAGRAAALLRAVDGELGHAEWASFGPPADAPHEAVAAAQAAAAQARAAAQQAALVARLLEQQRQQQQQQQLALGLQQEEQRRQQDAATAELVRLLMTQRDQAQPPARPAHSPFAQPARHLGTEPADAGAPAAPAWPQPQLGAHSFGAQIAAAASPLAAAAAAQRGLAALLSDAAVAPPAAPDSGDLLPSGYEDGGAWALAGLLDDQAPQAAAGLQPVTFPLGFGWNGSIWGRP